MTDLRVEERRNDDGTLDEVLLYVDGRCVFHLEQCGPEAWYLGLYPDPDPMQPVEQYWVSSKRRVRIANYNDTRRPKHRPPPFHWDDDPNTDHIPTTED